MATPVKTGVVGFGMAAQTFHCPLIAATANLDLAYVVQRSSDSAKEKYPGVTIVRSLAELLATDCALVVLATPSSDHYEQGKEVLTAGKHLVIDKPFTVTAKEADELVILAKEKGVVLTAFQNRRWDAGFLTLLQEKDKLGIITEYECRFDRYRPEVAVRWREDPLPGSGILYDLAPHLVDQAIALFGPPSAVRGDLRVQRPGAKVDDYCEVDLRWDSNPGLKVVLKASMLVRTLGPHLVVHGTDGSLVKSGLDPQEDALKAGGIPGSPNWGAEAEPNWSALTSKDGTTTRVSVPGNYLAYYENVADCVQRGAPGDLVISPEHSALVIRVVEAAVASSAAGALVRL